MDFTYTVAIPLIPLAVFLFLGLFGNKLKAGLTGLIGTAGLGTSMVLSLFTAYQYFFVLDTRIPEIVLNLRWLPFTENLVISMGIMLDPISVMMLVVVTLISFLVHMYSTGYMKGEDGYYRFFAYLSLFTFSMLGLVVSTNIFQMYVFWELVGVSSYLLIGFYYTKPSAVAASKKAFIVTRFADLGFLIGILLLGTTADTFDFISLNGQASTLASATGAGFMGLSTLTWALLLIFTGGAGKSAMFPLHVWLPDAMEGPTPVSALIHAATMVVAGVFMVARLFPLFIHESGIALETVAIVGGFSSLFAAIIACTQTDIKRVLAYSTMSQIGYMMLALGVCGHMAGGELAGEGLGYMAAMFHLFTHAMFKALLFLGAGAIIHAVHSNDMKDMGGLRKFMPITHITFLLACLAIAGIPPFAGFWSKDEILVAAQEHHMIYFLVEYLVAGITAFYMFRLYFNIFWGENKTYAHTPHEAPASMTIPLIVLGAGSVFAGFIPFHDLVTYNGLPLETHFHWVTAGASVAIALAGIGLAAFLYKRKNDRSDKIAASFKGLYTAAYNKFYIDEIYLFVTKKIVFNLISRPIIWFDQNVIDASMDGVATVTNFVSDKIKGLQSGQLQQYALVFISGVVALGLFFIYIWTH